MLEHSRNTVISFGGVADPFKSFLAQLRARVSVVPAFLARKLSKINPGHADVIAERLADAVDTVARWIDGDTDYQAMRRAMVFFNREFPGRYAATGGRELFRGQCVMKFDGGPRSYTYEKKVAEAFPASSLMAAIAPGGACILIKRRVCHTCADRAAFKLTLDLKKVLSDYSDNRFGDEKEVVILNTRPRGSTAGVIVRDNGRHLKPVHKISDRAKRYRANADDVRPADPRRCGFCGSRRNVGVHHIYGDESDSSAANLMWACKSCNQTVGARMRRAGIGKLTRQFNPGKRKGTRKALMQEYGNAIKVMRGDFEGDVSAAVATIRDTPADVRSAYTSRTWATRRALYGPSGRAGGSDVPF